MNDVARAVEQLTQNHWGHVNGREFESAPLLDHLRAAISSSVGAGSGGGSSVGGSVLNLAALELWELIDGIARGWLREWERDHTGELTEVVQRFHAEIQAQHSAGAFDDEYRERLDAAFGKWVYQIEDLFDPPHQKELTAPCPECGERYHLEEKTDGGKVVETTRRAAVTIPVKRGRAIIAECACCGAMWAGETDLTTLAESMGVDVDFVALREFATVTA